MQLCAVAKQVCAPQQCYLGCWRRAGCTASTANSLCQSITWEDSSTLNMHPCPLTPCSYWQNCPKHLCSASLVKEEHVIWDPSVPVGLTQTGEELGPDIYSPIAVGVVNSRFLHPVTKTQWLLFYLMEHGEAFCAKGSLILTEGAVERKRLGRGESPDRGTAGGHWEGSDEQQHTHAKPSWRRRLGEGQDDFECAVSVGTRVEQVTLQRKITVPASDECLG